MFQREVPLFLEIPAFPYNAVSDRSKKASVPECYLSVNAPPSCVTDTDQRAFSYMYAMYALIKGFPTF